MKEGWEKTQERRREGRAEKKAAVKTLFPTDIIESAALTSSRNKNKREIPSKGKGPKAPH